MLKQFGGYLLKGLFFFELKLKVLKRCSNFFCFLLIPAICLFATATGTAHAGEFQRLSNGIRPLGMGGAFITLSDDENALFYNPAGLNDIEGFHGVELLNPTVELSQSSINIIKDLKELDTEDVSEVTDFLSGIIGDHQHFRFSVFPNITFHNFSIGAVGSGVVDVVVRNRQIPEVITDVKADYGPVMGFAFGTYNSMLQFGLGGKFIQREGLSKTFQAVDIVNETFDPFDDREKKSDFAIDFGLKVNFPVFLKPSFGLVVQNITDLDFEELGKVPQTINLGFGLHPGFGKFKSAFIVELDDLTKEIESDLPKRLHVGAELRFPVILELRAGINQGWATYGATIDLWLLEIEYASYAEELGAFAGQIENRRHVAKISIGF